jgi:hypothetical protein
VIPQPRKKIIFGHFEHQFLPVLRVEALEGEHVPDAVRRWDAEGQACDHVLPPAFGEGDGYTGAALLVQDVAEVVHVNKALKSSSDRMMTYSAPVLSATDCHSF